MSEKENFLIDQLTNYADYQEKQLEAIRFLYEKNLSDEQINNYLQRFDIEDATYEMWDTYLLIKEKLKKNGVSFSKEQTTQLEGIKKYILCQNMQNAFAMRPLLAYCQEQKIPLLFIKGAAMLEYYEEKALRRMADFDIYVSRQYFDQVSTFLTQNSVEKKVFRHSIDFKLDEQIGIDLHTQLLKIKYPDEKIWSYTKKSKLYGYDVFYPVKELLLLVVLTNAFSNLIIASEKSRQDVRWINDVHHLLLEKTNIDWGLYRRICPNSNFLAISEVMLTFYNELTGENSISPEELFKTSADTQINKEKYLLYAKNYADIFEYSNNGKRFEKWQKQIHFENGPESSTLTDLTDILKLLYVKVGHKYSDMKGVSS